MVDSPSPPPPNDSAASSFAWYVARREAGERVDFDAWIHEHPEHREELRVLHAAWQQDATLTLDHSFFHRQADPESGEVASGPLSPGQRIGEFQLVKPLGRGGMGEVWEAEQASLSRRIALKLLLPGRGGDRAIEFFEREARAGGRLSHPGIVAIHASGQDEGLHWIAMELVEGGCTLAHFLEDMRKLDELPDGYYPQVAGFVAEIADAVAAAHEAGVIHRDLKPLNVLIGEDDAPKVGDFGLARVVDELSLSMTGDFAGTYFYMSPEQVMARRMGIDYRSDIFSLGVMVYELLTLARPFQGDTTHQIAEQIVMHDPPDPRQIRSRVPAELAVICGKAMEKKPGDRYADMAELAADLRRHLNDEPILAKPPTMVQRTVKWLRRNPAKSVTGAIAAVALVAISLLWLRAEEATQTARDATQTALQAKAATEVQRDLALKAEATAQRNAELADRRTYSASLHAASVALQDGNAAEARRRLND
ncbi:MAG: serine/threonine-protein kinase, partial [Polyangiaceae bacterium]